MENYFCSKFKTFVTFCRVLFRLSTNMYPLTSSGNPRKKSNKCARFFRSSGDKTTSNISGSLSSTAASWCASDPLSFSSLSTALATTSHSSKVAQRYFAFYLFTHTNSLTISRTWMNFKMADTSERRVFCNIILLKYHGKL